VPAIAAANAGEALVQIAAAEKGRYRPLDDRPPEAVLFGEPPVVDAAESVEMPVQQLPQAGLARIARTVGRQRLDARRHGENRTGLVIVYALPLDHTYTSCQADTASNVPNC